MATASYTATQSGKGQAATRVSRMWTDTHGRIWNSVVDTKDKSGHPCSPLVPVRWTAPVVPDQKYLTPDTEGGFQKITIRYEDWLKDLDTYETDWKTAVDKASLGYARGDQELYFELKAAPTAAILEMAGPKPLDRKYVLACMKGDQWALGLSSEYPGWAKKIWPDEAAFATAVTPKRNADHDFDFLKEDEEAKEEIATHVRRTVGVTSG